MNKRKLAVLVVPLLFHASAWCQQEPHPMSPGLKMVLPNVRAIQCIQFEASELDALTDDQLQQLACDYQAGIKFTRESTQQAIAKEKDPRTRTALKERETSRVERCEAGISHVSELMRRKNVTKKECPK